ncbi:MAG TPA: endonuclease/exonuclease/phosphatase family protein [Bacteroidales bacterium]|nr:endonuclease/exonuclease/phosphatase family protein [Bacteroidales bacterium]
MTLNLRYDNPRDSINAWPNRAGQVCEFIEDQAPDIFGMQEVLWHQYMYLDSALAEYGSAGAGRDDGNKGGELNPVFYRKDKYDAVRTITFWLSDTPDFPGSKAWGSSLPRVVTWIELVKKDTHEHFFYFNTHFAHDSDSARTMSSQMVLDKVAEIAQGFPFIITGDLNMMPDSKGYAILTGPDESVSLLKDSYFISEEKPEGPAYTFNGFSDKPGTGRIDYILVRNGMKVLEHRTFDQKEGNVFISDHWPVIAKVSF